MNIISDTAAMLTHGPCSSSCSSTGLAAGPSNTSSRKVDPEIKLLKLTCSPSTTTAIEDKEQAHPAAALTLGLWNKFTQQQHSDDSSSSSDQVVAVSSEPKVVVSPVPFTSPTRAT